MNIDEHDFSSPFSYQFYFHREDISYTQTDRDWSYILTCVNDCRSLRADPTEIRHEPDISMGWLLIIVKPRDVSSTTLKKSKRTYKIRKLRSSIVRYVFSKRHLSTDLKPNKRNRDYLMNDHFSTDIPVARKFDYQERLAINYIKVFYAN